MKTGKTIFGIILILLFLIGGFSTMLYGNPNLAGIVVGFVLAWCGDMVRLLLFGQHEIESFISLFEKPRKELPRYQLWVNIFGGLDGIMTMNGVYQTKDDCIASDTDNKRISTACIYDSDKPYPYPLIITPINK